MTLLDTTVSAGPAGESSPAGRADLTRASLEALAAMAGDVLDDAARLDGAPLADLADLAEQLDQVIDVLKQARGRIGSTAVVADGWEDDGWSDSDSGLRAVREWPVNSKWNDARAAGRLAPVVCADPVTGELDATPEQAERILRRWLAFAATAYLRTKPLKKEGVRYSDLVERDPRPARVRVFRETPAAQVAGGSR